MKTLCPSAEGIYRNMSRLNDERPFKCDTCDYRTNFRSNLKKHVLTHSDERPFKCDICDYRARTRDKLKRHLTTHIDERPFKCDICDYRTRFRSNLKTHVSTHSHERLFKCDICDYRTHFRSNLNTHVSTHSLERPFKCDICHYRARTGWTLKNHILSHSDERPFKCDICDYRARIRGNLKQHVASHSHERPFKCDTCDYRTRIRGSLKTHVATHSDERPFKCSFCDFAAKSKQSLRAHIVSRHSSKSGVEPKIKKTVASKGKNKYGPSKFIRKCRFCMIVFKSRESLISHENICRSIKRERIYTKDNSEKPNQGNIESNFPDSKDVRSESRSTAVGDFVEIHSESDPDEPRNATESNCTRSERIGSNFNQGLSERKFNTICSTITSEEMKKEDPDEPRNTTESNCTRSERIGSNFNQGLSERKFNTICSTITSEEMKKEAEPVSNDNFSSELHFNCVKLEKESAMPLSANEAIYGPYSEAMRRELSVKWEEPIDHLKKEFGFHNNDVVDHETQFTNKQCSIILTKLEDSGNYHGCYYIRMKEAPYLYEVVKVNLNPVI